MRTVENIGGAEVVRLSLTRAGVMRMLRQIEEAVMGGNVTGAASRTTFRGKVYEIEAGFSLPECTVSISLMPSGKGGEA